MQLHRYGSRAALALAVAALAPHAAAAKKTFAVAHDAAAAPALHVFALSKNGGLAAVVGSPFALPGAGGLHAADRRTLAWLPQRNLLFAADTGGVCALRLGKTGAIEVVPGSPFALSDEIVSVAVASSGKRWFVCATDRNDRLVRVLELAADDSLVPLAATADTGTNPLGCAAAGSRLFVANSSSSSVSSFSIDASGAPIEAAESPLATSPYAGNTVALAPSGATLYLPEPDARLILVERVAKGTADLTLIGLTPFPSSFSGSLGGLAVSSKGIGCAWRSGGAGNNDLLSFRREEDFGFLVQEGTPQDSALPALDAAAFSPDGKFLVLASDTADLVKCYAVDKKTAVTAETGAASAAASNVAGLLVVQR